MKKHGKKYKNNYGKVRETGTGSVDMNTAEKDINAKEAEQNEKENGFADAAGAKEAEPAEEIKEEAAGAETSADGGAGSDADAAGGKGGNDHDGAEASADSEEGTDSKEAGPDEAGDSQKEGKKDKKDQQIEELTDKYKRLFAEFDNYRKRTENEKLQQFSEGEKTVLLKVLPLIDNFERALASVPDDKEAGTWAEGIEKIYKAFMDQLKSFGVETIEAAGKTFDPNLHYAVMHVEDENEPENIVVEELQKGYMFKDKVLRFSMVKVAN